MMTLLTPAEEQALIQRLYARDEKALAEFYQHYKPTLLFTIRRLVQHDELAKDIVQEGFMRCWLAFPTYDSRKGRLFTWALNICRNLAIDYLRAQRREQAATSPLTATEAQEVVAPVSFKPEHIGVRDWLNLVGEADRVLLDLLYLQGYTQSEAAEELHLPLGTVKSRTRRLLNLLTQIMGHPATRKAVRRARLLS
jgi:RNA polymerase sigma factor (sigma-70 family)